MHKPLALNYVIVVDNRTSVIKEEENPGKVYDGIVLCRVASNIWSASIGLN